MTNVNILTLKIFNNFYEIYVNFFKQEKPATYSLYKITKMSITRL